VTRRCHIGRQAGWGHAALSSNPNLRGGTVSGGQDTGLRRLQGL
jgi:hypothetical protein